MVRAVERKVRSRAQQLYESRGQTEGQALQDWFQAESEVLENNMAAPLYRRMRSSSESDQNAREIRAGGAVIRLRNRSSSPQTAYFFANALHLLRIPLLRFFQSLNHRRYNDRQTYGRIDEYLTELPSFGWRNEFAPGDRLAVRTS